MYVMNEFFGYYVLNVPCGFTLPAQTSTVGARMAIVGPEIFLKQTLIGTSGRTGYVDYSWDKICNWYVSLL